LEIRPYASFQKQARWNFYGMKGNVRVASVDATRGVTPYIAAAIRVKTPPSAP
jgi:hypothetical protein